MADILDVTQVNIDVHINAAIRNIPIYSGQSLHFCAECGNRIPENRRNAIPGCKLCFECQTRIEQKSKLITK